MEVIEHHIQRTIIDRLMHAERLKFSQLKPDGMESNIFMYHLKQLMKDGFVSKIDAFYSLSSKGQTYVDGLSTENQKPRPQPKLIVVLALQNPAGKWLLAERKIQPYIGTRMFPSGKQHRGETSAVHAVRELEEKTGLQGIALTHRGMAEILISDAAGTLLTHAVAHVYDGTLADTAVPPETDRFRFVWHDFAADTARLMPGTAELWQELNRYDDTFSIELSL